MNPAERCTLAGGSAGPFHERSGGTDPAPADSKDPHAMSQDIFVERFFETLISGHRNASRQIVAEALQSGATARDVVSELFWPTYEMVEKLYRSDQLTRLSHHMATRLLRVLVDQNASRFTCASSRNRTIFALCGPKDADELGAQMAVDLLENAGFDISFGGGGIPNDEILAHVHESQPDVLLLFASAPSDLPEIRELIDTLHEINACPNLQIVVGGGVFNRAEGLAEEIGADMWARSPMELAEMLIVQPTKRAALDQRTVGRRRKVRREAA
jgi:MerR family transcriptional regulator, light-induced transcriptional regulator